MNTSKKISVFIVDDHPLMRKALKASILTESDMEVVGVAADGEAAIAVIPALQPSIVLMDLMMPNMDGFVAINSLVRIFQDMHILVLSSLEDEEAVFKAVQAGARGYLTKDVQHDELIEAIRTVSAGKSYLPAGITEKLMSGMRQSLLKEEEANAADLLTRREREVLGLLAKGYSNVKISETLVITASTVRVHLHQIMKKMGFKDRREAIVFATRQITKE